MAGRGRRQLRRRGRPGAKGHPPGRAIHCGRRNGRRKKEDIRMNPSHASLKEAHGRRPDAAGHFGPFGGRYVAETLMPAVIELEEAYRRIASDPAFQQELSRLLRDYAGRPTPLFPAERLTAQAGGAAIYLKREDLAHTGAHKINNTVGQALLARWMGKRKLIAETGAGQHGVATATTAALFGME